MTTAPDAQALPRLLAPVGMAVPSAAQVKTWLMAEINLPRLTGMIQSTRDIGSKMYAVWLKLDGQQITASDALDEFQGWAGENPDLVDAYCDQRDGMLRKVGGGRDTSRGREILRARSVAMAEAFRETRQHQHGPDTRTGKTVACFVLVSTRAFWVGRSGFGHHTQVSHPRMTTLLAGVHKVEEWEPSVCAEVDCMKQALTAGAAEDDLVWYCFTWNARSSRWTGRSACLNCRQWLAGLVLRTT